MLEFILDLVASKKCYSCNKKGHFLCNKCIYKLTNFEDICYFCKNKTDNYKIHDKCRSNYFFDKVIIGYHYKNKIIKKMIKDFKFYNNLSLVKFFSYELSKLFFNNVIYKNKEDFILVYPPMSFTKKLVRGYNQAEVLSKNISNILQIKHGKNFILKNKSTRQQSLLIRQERLLNVKNSFKINKKYLDKVANNNFIIVDDVISTGSTLNEVSKILKKHGANEIICLVIASD